MISQLAKTLQGLAPAQAEKAVNAAIDSLFDSDRARLTDEERMAAAVTEARQAMGWSPRRTWFLTAFGITLMERFNADYDNRAQLLWEDKTRIVAGVAQML